MRLHVEVLGWTSQTGYQLLPENPPIQKLVVSKLPYLDPELFVYVAAAQIVAIVQQLNRSYILEVHEPYGRARLITHRPLQLYLLLVVGFTCAFFVGLTALALLARSVRHRINKRDDLFAGETQFADLIETEKLQQTDQHHLPFGRQ